MTVDDEEDVTFCLSLVLQETGLFEVDRFTDPQHALSSFKPGMYDLVISDIRMPEMDGLELYKRIKLLDKNVDVCFLTAVKDFNEYKVVHRDITDEIAKNDDMLLPPLGNLSHTSILYRFPFSKTMIYKYYLQAGSKKPKNNACYR